MDLKSFSRWYDYSRARDDMRSPKSKKRKTMYYNGLGWDSGWTLPSRSRNNRDLTLLLALSPDEC